MLFYHTKYAAVNEPNSAPAAVNTLVKHPLSYPLTGILINTVPVAPGIFV